MANDERANFIAFVGLRKLLSLEENPRINQCIDANLVPILVNKLKEPQSQDKFLQDEIKYEITWALTNIASGTSTHV